MTTELTSKNNENVKFISKLLTSSKFRNKEKLFVVEGIRLCEEALKHNIEITKIFYTPSYFEKYSDLINEIIKKNNPKKFLINQTVLNAISDTPSPQGLVCLCKFIDKKVNLAKIKAYSNIILLENLQNPSNLGSILRSLSAFNIDFVAISANSCDIYNPKVLRGSMGAIFRLNILKVENFLEFISFLKNENFSVCATVPCQEAENIVKLSEISKKAVIFGNEGNGITKETLNLCNRKMTIPMNSDCESLSVAVATSLVAWEMSGRKF